MQIVFKTLLVFQVFPYVDEGNWCIFLTTICWSSTEVLRFTFYSLKTLQVDTLNSSFGSMISTLRYNTFIGLYPAGFTGELLSYYAAWKFLKSAKEKGSDVPFSLFLPNQYNISFDYELFLRCIPIIYAYGCPALYFHMWR